MPAPKDYHKLKMPQLRMRFTVIMIATTPRIILSSLKTKGFSQGQNLLFLKAKFHRKGVPGARIHYYNVEANQLPWNRPRKRQEIGNV